jgi:hypothetical protein
MDIEMLINEVYQRPLLWDTSTDDYKNKNKKTTAWREVARAVFKDMKKNTEAEQEMICKYTLWSLILTALSTISINIYATAFKQCINEVHYGILLYCHGTSPSFTK